MDMQSDLARARGTGSAKEGIGHWWMQRLTAIALVPLSLWFVISALSLGGLDLAGFKAWLNAPGNLLLMILFVFCSFYHMMLGLQVVVEDYVHTESSKVALLVVNTLGTVFIGASCIVALLKVALGG